MLPVPRTTLASMLKSQTATAPAKTTREYATAASRAPSRAPIAWYSGRPPGRTTAVNTPPRTSAMTIAWATSASAWARRPAPSARATAEATPPPMPPADIVCISMTSGNVTEIPARASGPRRPTK